MERNVSATEWELLEPVLAGLSEAVILTDPDGCVTFLNPEARRLTGWGEEAIGQPLEEVFFPSRNWRPGESEIEFSELLTARGKPDAPLPIQGRRQSISDRNGNGKYQLITFQDTSELARARRERLEAEARFQVLIENLPAAAYLCDAEGRITYFNDKAVEVWGREPRINHDADRYCGSFKLFSARDGSAIAHDACWMARALKEDGKFAGEEIVVERQDGSRRTALAHAAPIKDENGAIRGAVNILIDITDRKRAEEKLLDSDRRKDEFLAMLAHELRNPLASISNAMELLATTRQPEQNQELRGNIQRQIKQMIRLIEDLLDTSRMTRGKLNLRMEPIDASEVINAAAETTRAMFQRNSQRFKISQTGDRLPLKGDSVRLTQVLVNLLNNASKFAPCGGQIELSSELIDGQIVLTVRDNGIGIDPEDQSHIFEMFVQADESTERMRSGLGIGLYLVHKIVEMHGGRTTVHSDGIGCGSEFRVYLPLAHNQSENETAIVIDQPAGASYRILVVDDVKDIASLFSLMLCEMGHEVDYALNGITALEKIKLNPPDIVFSDISMPMMNGYTLAKIIRTELGMTDLVLIAVSGYGQAHDKERAFEAGFDYHLIKPAEVGTLKEIFGEIGSRIPSRRSRRPAEDDASGADSAS